MKKLVHNLAGGQLYNKAVLPKHFGVAALTNLKYKFPARGLKVIGVTGTNGKTSTCFLIHRMLCEAGYNAGLLTTVAYGVGDNLKPQIHHMTSQPIGLLMQRLIAMKAEGMDVVVLEVTSHALSQYRILGVPIDIAVFTNLTHEHLDYHGSFEAYRSAKMKLFKMASRNKKGHRLGIVNADDPSAEYFARCVPHVLKYGLKSGEGVSVPHNLKLTPKGSSFDVTINGQVVHIDCNLPGSFNVANSLAAAQVGVALGLSSDQISRGIAALDGVEGRMTRIDEGQDFDVIVDFAHTPDSFEKLFSDLRPVVKGKLICMFGSAGRRDETKRAIQGRIAGASSDIVVITEEDDRDIDGIGIMNQIAEGAESAGKVRDKDLFLVHDRTEAIAFTLSKASKGDTVLLLGKGHEKTIERADGEHPWDEIGTAREVLAGTK